MVILIIRSVIPESPDLIGQFFIIGHNCSCVAQSSQILSGIKAESGGVSERSGLLSLIGSPVCLRAVFNDLEPVLLSDSHDRVHVAGLSVKVDRHNSLSLFSYRSFDERGIDIESPDIRFNKYRRRAHICHCQSSSDVGIGRHNDFVSLTDTERLQREHQSIEPIADAYAVLRSAILCERLFKRLVFDPFYIP